MTWRWDEAKAARNYEKHGVSFALAELAFDDPMHISEPDLHPDGDLWRTMGGSEARARLNHMKEDTMRRVISPRLTPELLAESLRVAQMPDANIDFSDISPLEEGFWKDAVRGKFYRPVKKQVTLRLDADLIDWFKAKQAGGRGYQTAINAALRGVVEEERRKVG